MRSRPITDTSTSSGGSPLIQSSSQQAADEKNEEFRHVAHYARYNYYPLTGISSPHNHDVLFGRGGGTNNHPGNKRYRELVEERKSRYVSATRTEKPLIAMEIITFLREEQNPPGRFLQLNETTKKWDDVGCKRAREKASQALREKFTPQNYYDDKKKSPQTFTTTITTPTYTTSSSTSPIPDPSSVLHDINEMLYGSSPRYSSETSQLDELEHELSASFSDIFPNNKEDTLLRNHSLAGNPLPNIINNNKAPFLPGNVLKLTFEHDTITKVKPEFKRATSNNAEIDALDKYIKMPRASFERQHSLAAVPLEGARLDLPATMFDEVDQPSSMDLSRQLSDFSMELQNKTDWIMPPPCSNDLSRQFSEFSFRVTNDDDDDDSKQNDALRESINQS
mmetsp:Transcript_11767/g.16973  ORF Transcript_11767/g.16973 Transcript_11767/m.16973 type:complete len:394 (-) Transcript_11767:2697-3878(-)